MSKMKINIDRPQVSAEEIKQKRNFREIYKQYQELEKKPVYKKRWALLALTGVLLISGAAFFIIKQDPTAPAVSPSEKNGKTEKPDALVISQPEKKQIDEPVPGTRQEIIPAEKPSAKTARKNSVQKNSETKAVITTTTPVKAPSDLPAKNHDQEIKILQEEIVTLNEKIKKLEAEKPLQPVLAKGYRFKIDVMPKEFPKLAKYKDLLFEVAPDEKNFSSDFVKKEWDSGKIKGDGNNGYMLTLTSKDQSYTFKVIPVFEGKGYEKALESFTKYTEQIDSLTALRSEKEAQLNQYQK